MKTAPCPSRHPLKRSVFFASHKVPGMLDNAAIRTRDFDILHLDGIAALAEMVNDLWESKDVPSI
jgi:hypothetical protein